MFSISAILLFMLILALGCFRFGSIESARTCDVVLPSHASVAKIEHSKNSCIDMGEHLESKEHSTAGMKIINDIEIFEIDCRSVSLLNLIRSDSADSAVKTIQEKIHAIDINESGVSRVNTDVLIILRSDRMSSTIKSLIKESNIKLVLEIKIGKGRAKASTKNILQFNKFFCIKVISIEKLKGTISRFFSSENDKLSIKFHSKNKKFYFQRTRQGHKKKASFANNKRLT
ncbi:MAG: hypothetical protein KAH32_02450 [Chlamydiia bacterium]|nr:hypothetical protein [Chlamydiia bacterium]